MDDSERRKSALRLNPFPEVLRSAGKEYPGKTAGATKRKGSQGVDV
jgi:hypothetical protein